MSSRTLGGQRLKNVTRAPPSCGFITLPSTHAIVKNCVIARHGLKKFRNGRDLPEEA